ncbi:DUF1365 domain-containing protein [Luteitalea sp. TBR-22]|uniref:DUF1365 domain-containing protein n=1 Tax=Luteitalea sp. TBR-22 TaxID=2802971 RepID=UPI001AF50FA7|nr:DUF1365 domain-containing protein [Luteitalea sp. TBR-22]BCS34356.1 DUF1365 domain-containing protein [Luteitalea sp. TBR-22]
MTRPIGWLYRGRVWHARSAPRHAFEYGTYMHLFDLDEVGRINGTHRLLGYNRRRLVGLHDADHLDGRPLRAAIEHALVSRGHAWPGGRVLLLTHCRVAGYVFNPVSFFYCFDPDGRLATVVAEVNNTYGERHVYVLPSEAPTHKKEFHVSPFFGLDGTYRFALEAPGEDLTVGIDLTVGEDRRFEARLALRRKRLTDGALAGLLARQPLVTAQVIAAIHWEALRLWWKGVPFRDKPAYAPDAARQTQP